MQASILGTKLKIERVLIHILMGDSGSEGGDRLGWGQSPGYWGGGVRRNVTSFFLFFFFTH